jgi:hypothetical protein
LKDHIEQEWVTRLPTQSDLDNQSDAAWECFNNDKSVLNSTSTNISWLTHFLEDKFMITLTPFMPRLQLISHSCT